MKTSSEDNPRYVAVGLSEDAKMGDDSVMECVRENGRIQAYSSWNTPRPNIGNTRQDVVSFSFLCRFSSAVQNQIKSNHSIKTANFSIIFTSATRSY